MNTRMLHFTNKYIETGVIICPPGTLPKLSFISERRCRILILVQLVCLQITEMYFCQAFEENQ